MSQKKLNLGILAHVDAGKTTLTERLLFAAGVIDQPGSVDAGTTQTDSLALERQRGITIKSAVTSFPIGEVAVNLIDTPGHPDFIAEVERVLSVLDGAVLVVSAVDGVQPQTRILSRTLRRLRIPTLVFVNKIDRQGAGDESVLRAISERLGLAIIPMGSPCALGTRCSEFMPWGADDAGFRARLTEALAEHDDAIMAAYIEDEEGVPYWRLQKELAAQTTRALVHPVFFGSAITGAGIGSLTAGIAELLPVAAGDPEGPISGSVFKIERGVSGEKIAYVRMFSGTVRTRDRLRFGVGKDDKVTSIAVFDRGSAARRGAVSAGEIGKVWGLADVQIGDRVGQVGTDGTRHQFPPPTLESVIVAHDRADGARLNVALGQIAEQDPLINVRQDDNRQETYVSLYGEVQKEVIQATLANDFGIEVAFRETTIIYVERLVGIGSAVEVLQADTHPFSATVGLRVEPAPAGSGLRFLLDVHPRDVPLYIYKTTESFAEAMTQYVRDTLRQGLYGWQVIDCLVSMNQCNYYVGDGPRKQVLATQRTTAADYRKLTPLVLMRAVKRAGVTVCEPMTHVTLELPVATMGGVLAALAQLGAAVGTPSVRGELSVLEAVLPAAQVHNLRQQLPRLSSGEGALEAAFGGYQPVRGISPSRPRTDSNPLDPSEYIRTVL